MSILLTILNAYRTYIDSHKVIEPHFLSNCFQSWNHYLDQPSEASFRNFCSCLKPFYDLFEDVNSSDNLHRSSHQLLFRIELSYHPTVEEVLTAYCIGEINKHWTENIDRFASQPLVSRERMSYLLTTEWRQIQDAFYFKRSEQKDDFPLVDLLLTYQKCLERIAIGLIHDVAISSFFRRVSKSQLEWEKGSCSLSSSVFIKGMINSLVWRYAQVDKEAPGEEERVLEQDYLILIKSLLGKEEGMTKTTPLNEIEHLFWLELSHSNEWKEAMETQVEHALTFLPLERAIQAFAKTLWAKKSANTAKEETFNGFLKKVESLIETYPDSFANRSGVKKVRENLKNRTIISWITFEDNAESNPIIVSKQKLVEVLKIDPKTVYNWTRDGFIHNHGSKYRPQYNINEVISYMQSIRKKD